MLYDCMLWFTALVFLFAKMHPYVLCSLVVAAAVYLDCIFPWKRQEFFCFPLLQGRQATHGGALPFYTSPLY